MPLETHMASADPRSQVYLTMDSATLDWGAWKGLQEPFLSIRGINTRGKHPGRV